jgi:predicted nucleic acid-binding protein
VVTAVDTNIFFDIISGDAQSNALATRALKRAASDGRIVISAVSYAEIAIEFTTASELDLFLTDLKVEITPLDRQTAFLAGQFHREYKLRGGTRTRILADFLIAAHGQLHADRLLTRDDRFFSEAFPQLKAIAPSEL